MGGIDCSSLGRYFWSDFVVSVLLKSPVPTKGAQPAAAIAQWGLCGRRGASCPEIRKRFSPETKGPQTWTFTSAAPGWSLPHRSIQRRNIWGRNLAQLMVRHGLCVHLRTNKAIQPKVWPPGNPFNPLCFKFVKLLWKRFLWPLPSVWCFRYWFYYSVRCRRLSGPVSTSRAGTVFLSVVKM